MYKATGNVRICGIAVVQITPGNGKSLAFLPLICLTVMSFTGSIFNIRNYRLMNGFRLQLGSVPPKVTAFSPTDRQDLNGTRIVIRERIC